MRAAVRYCATPAGRVAYATAAAIAARHPERVAALAVAQIAAWVTEDRLTS